MKADNFDYLFEDKHAVASFHDVVVDVLGKSLLPEQLKEVFAHLPKDTRNIAVIWGMSDTVFRDYAFEWLEKNKDSVCV